ncbi:hypothetical protein [Amycolatopsis sp. cmx-4-83]|uniref:hypothetical protein n=1 Tax=Amycolatopsis sp. cmx-4-83 TaxID=2790940 RepID=UPI0039790874
MTTTDKPRMKLKYAVIGVVVLLVAGGIVTLIMLLSGPAPVDYKITATGAGTTMWITPDGSGEIVMVGGSGTETVHAGKVSVIVGSTPADGASCQITGPSGKVVDSQMTHRGGSSVTCSTP